MMNNIFRSAEVYVNDVLAAILSETDSGYSLIYNEEYLNSDLPSISLTLPKQKEEYRSSVLFPFFDGLIPEGWLLDIAVNNWKINPKDRFGLLLVSANDPIGNVSVKRI